MSDILFLLSTLWRPIIEIPIIAIVFYYIYLFIRDTRALQLTKGFFILILAFFIAEQFKLYAISWILTELFPISIIGFIIIFHPEIRRALAQLGKRPFFSLFEKDEDYKEQHLSEVIVNAIIYLAEKKIGALIALERDIGLKNYYSTGVAINGEISQELLCTIFMPHTPLHDGGIIICEDKIMAAATLFPLSQRPFITQMMGTRHRAAVGLTEETDALVLVVSEETGVVSLASGGKINKDIPAKELKLVIKNFYISKKQKMLKRKSNKEKKESE